MGEHDLTEFLGDGGEDLKIPSTEHPEGRWYHFRSPNFETGLWLKNVIEFGQKANIRERVGGKLTAEEARDLAKDVGKLVLDDDEEQDMYRRVMGDTFDEMRADDVNWDNTQRVFGILLNKWGNSQPIEVTLEKGKATAPNRTARRAAAKKAPTASPAKRPARKAGLKSSQARTPRKKAPASGDTRGRTSGQASGRSSGTAAAKPA